MEYPNYKKYAYDGPVKMFGKTINERWSGTTTAPSEKKALSNLAYQYKKAYNKAASARVELPGKLIMLV